MRIVALLQPTLSCVTAPILAKVDPGSICLRQLNFSHVNILYYRAIFKTPGTLLLTAVLTGVPRVRQRDESRRAALFAGTALII